MKKAINVIGLILGLLSPWPILYMFDNQDKYIFFIRIFAFIGYFTLLYLSFRKLKDFFNNP